VAADVFADDDKVIVRVEAPGLRREDFNGSFRRDVALPVSAKPDQTKASYRDGVRRIELPKADAARARRTAVKTV
jgi:HSP20 family protein